MNPIYNYILIPDEPPMTEEVAWICLGVIGLCFLVGVISLFWKSDD